jgi:hypothetical protein
MKKILAIIAVALLFVIASSAVVMAKQEEIEQDDITDTFKLKQGYRLYAEINVEATKTWIQLIRANGDVIDDHVFENGEYFSLYDDETLIVEARKLTIFKGLFDSLVVMDDLVQYNKNTGNPILTMDKVIFVWPSST